VAGKDTLGPGKTLTPDGKAEFIRLAGQLRSNLDGTQHGLDRAFANNLAQNLTPRLAGLLRDYVAATADLLHVVEREAVRGGAIRITPAEFERVAAAHRAACLAFWDQAAVELVGLLTAQ
jgi:hypothetical protein